MYIQLLSLKTVTHLHICTCRQNEMSKWALTINAWVLIVTVAFWNIAIITSNKAYNLLMIFTCFCQDDQHHEPQQLWGMRPHPEGPKAVLFCPDLKSKLCTGEHRPHGLNYDTCYLGGNWLQSMLANSVTSVHHSQVYLGCQIDTSSSFQSTQVVCDEDNGDESLIKVKQKLIYIQYSSTKLSLNHVHEF